MRLIKFAIVALLTLCLAYIANLHDPLASSTPAMGAFLSPFHGFWQNAESGSEKKVQTLSFSGLENEVKVVMDERLVPHIFAENTRDAIFVQGYLTAKYRLWQIDFAYRAISGRLSEVLGERALEYDRLQRRLGFSQNAKQSLAAWQSSEIDALIVNAYTNGVNAYIKKLKPADYPLEFKLLGYAPEEWTPLKSALQIQSMAKSLCFGAGDLGATNARHLLGKEMYDFLYPDWNPRQSPIIPKDTPWDFEAVDTTDLASSQPLMSGLTHFRSFPQPNPFLGSNNWAVAGAKTLSGNPILCNDPHLGLTLPAIWYEVQIHLPDANVYGVNIPGLPGIVIGFNEFTAWGMTNVGHDVLDWYKVAWTDSTRYFYYLDNEIKEVDRLEERIYVRGWKEPLRDTVKYTHWGPVTYEEEGDNYRGMAMYWLPKLAVQRQDFYELGVFYHLTRSKNYEDYQKALSAYSFPAQNVVFAAKDGDIAITVAGKLPLKRQQQGKFIQDGSLSANGWSGFIPWRHNPRIRNPKRNFVASANQHTTDPTYPYYYFAPFDDYRGRIINRELARFDSASITVEDMMALQNSNYSLFPEEALPLLLGLLNESELSETDKERLRILREWDFRFEADQSAPVIFDQWRRTAYRLTFDEIEQLSDSVEIQYPETWRFLDLLERSPEHKIFDKQATKSIETASSVITEAFMALDTLLLAQNWATEKSTDILHLMRLPAFSHENLEIGGYSYAPNALSRTHGPSWRMIVELGDEPKAWGVYPGGQSGNPGSPYYDDALKKWSKGEYYSLFFMKNPEDRRQNVLFTMNFKK